MWPLPICFSSLETNMIVSGLFWDLPYLQIPGDPYGNMEADRVLKGWQRSIRTEGNVGCKLMNWPGDESIALLMWHCDISHTDQMQPREANSNHRRKVSRSTWNIFLRCSLRLSTDHAAQLIRSGTGRNAITGRLGERLPLFGIKWH